jgi:hypothetical protein
MQARFMMMVRSSTHPTAGATVDIDRLTSHVVRERRTEPEDGIGRFSDGPRATENDAWERRGLYVSSSVTTRGVGSIATRAGGGVPSLRAYVTESDFVGIVMLLRIQNLPESVLSRYESARNPVNLWRLHSPT